MCSLEDKKIGSLVGPTYVILDDLTLVICDCTLYMEDLRLFSNLNTLFKPSLHIQPTVLSLGQTGQPVCKMYK